MKIKTNREKDSFSFEIENGKGILKEIRKTAIGNISPRYKISLPKEEVEKYNLLKGKIKITIEKL